MKPSDRMREPYTANDLALQRDVECLRETASQYRPVTAMPVPSAARRLIWF